MSKSTFLFVISSNQVLYRLFAPPKSKCKIIFDVRVNGLSLVAFIPAFKKRLNCSYDAVRLFSSISSNSLSSKRNVGVLPSGHNIPFVISLPIWIYSGATLFSAQTSRTDFVYSYTLSSSCSLDNVSHDFGLHCLLGSAQKSL